MRPRNRQQKTGFTFVDILLAIGVFGLTIIGMIALLTPVTRQVRDIFESDIAGRAINTINSKLRYMEDAQGNRGFFFFVDEDLTGIRSGSLPLQLYVNSDGSRARLQAEVDALPAESRVSARFFLVTIDAFDLDEDGQTYDPGEALLPLSVTLEWPYELPDGSIVVPDSRNDYSFFSALVAGQ